MIFKSSFKSRKSVGRLNRERYLIPQKRSSWRKCSFPQFLLVRITLSLILWCDTLDCVFVNSLFSQYFIKMSDDLMYTQWRSCMIIYPFKTDKNTENNFLPKTEARNSWTWINIRTLSSNRFPSIVANWVDCLKVKCEIIFFVSETYMMASCLSTYYVYLCCVSFQDGHWHGSFLRFRFTFRFFEEAKW